MTEAVSLPDFNSPIINHARKDFPLLDAGMSVADALERIRRQGVGERVIYFFATDAEGRLVGVLPTRRLLTASLETRLEEIMVRRVVAIPASATVLVLGLNESVSMQSMTLTIQALRVNTLTRRWFLDNLRREIVTSLLLGMACGLLVSAIVWLWRRDVNGAAVVGGGIAVSLVTACLLGFSVPSLLHRLKLDPKIAAGPVTLAVTDFFALTFYFSLAWLLL
jgi:Mg/Co/Ni transporter MgtE